MLEQSTLEQVAGTWQICQCHLLIQLPLRRDGCGDRSWRLGDSDGVSMSFADIAQIET